MKIYRTVTLPKLLFVLLFLPTVFIAINLFRNRDISLNFSIELVFTVLSMMGFSAMAVFGPMHYKYLHRSTDGYKYFRSLPDAYRKYKRTCIAVSGGFAAVGGAILIMLALTGFRNMTLICLLSVYAFTYAMQHIMAQSENANVSDIHIITAGGAMGVMMTAIDDVTAVSPIVLGIMVPALMILVAIGCTAYFYSRFDTLWYKE